MNNRYSRFFSILAAGSISLCCLQIPAMAAPAENPKQIMMQTDSLEQSAFIQNVSYLALDESGSMTEHSCVQAAAVTSDQAVWGEDDGRPHWYIANSDVTLTERVEIRGEVHLILGDSSTLMAPKGIDVTASHSLQVYGQSEGEETGWLVAVITETANAAIGSSANNQSGAGAMTFNGGHIVAHQKTNGGAGIGGGQNSPATKITINGGTIDASSRPSTYDPAAIGGGSGNTGGDIVINGGYITAYGSGQQAIGNGANTSGQGSITIRGGYLNVNGIGNGVWNQSCPIRELSGCWIEIQENDSQDLDLAGIVPTDCVIFSKDPSVPGRVYGSPVIREAVRVPFGRTLTLDPMDGAFLTLTEHGALTNQGTINGTGVIRSILPVVNAGVITGSVTVEPDSIDSIIEVDLPDHAVYLSPIEGTVRLLDGLPEGRVDVCLSRGYARRKVYSLVSDGYDQTVRLPLLGADWPNWSGGYAAPLQVTAVFHPKISSTDTAPAYAVQGLLETEYEIAITPQALEPTTVRWNQADKVSWTAVEKADSYQVSLYAPSSSNRPFWQTETDQTSADLPTLNEKGDWMVSVVAKSTHPGCGPSQAAQADLRIHSITFDHESIDASRKTVLVAHGRVIGSDQIPTPSQNGYTHTGWENADGAVDLSQPVESDLELRPTFSINTYTVTFVSEGETVKTETVAHGETLEPFTPTRKGYRFICWKENYFGPWEWSYPILNNYVLKAFWIREHTIRFFDDKGNVISEQTIDDESILRQDRIPEAVKEGSEFDCWVLNGEPYDFTQRIQEDLDLYPRYFMNVSFRLSTSDEAFGQMQRIPFGQTIEKPQDDPAKDGYVFKGWFHQDEPYDFSSPVKTDLELTGRLVKLHTVAFVDENGTELSSLTIEEGTVLSADQIPAPKREGWILAGWKAQDVAFDPNTPISQDLQLKPDWVAERTVTFKDENGKVLATLKAAEGTVLDATSIPVPVKEGYTFVGWMCNGKPFSLNEPINMDCELAAVFEKTPEKPDKPSQPDKPNQPDKPDKPDQTDKPDRPGQTQKPNDGQGTQTAATVSMFRLYNPNSGEHFYTGDAHEQSVLVRLGWRDEGTGWISPSTSSVPVYRLYNPNAGDHHYTMNRSERDSLIKKGWNDEGIGWYSDEKKSVPVYHQYNPNARTGAHNYTTSRRENDVLASLGWKEHGILWYAVKAADQK